MALAINVGSVEKVVVTITDVAGLLTDLGDAANHAFDVYPVELDGSNGTAVVTNEPATYVGMILFCLVDTTAWTVGRYRLYVHFDVDTETPILGPVDLYVQ